MRKPRETHPPQWDAISALPWIDTPELDADWWLRHPLYRKRATPAKDTDTR